MRILLDECVPRGLKRSFPGHVVLTVPAIGYAGKKNGELLPLISGKFDVLVTTDVNLQYQQRLSTYDIAFALLRSWMTGSPWHNTMLAADVNQDGTVTEADAYAVADTICNDPYSSYTVMGMTDEQTGATTEALARVRSLEDGSFAVVTPLARVKHRLAEERTAMMTGAQVERDERFFPDLAVELPIAEPDKPGKHNQHEDRRHHRAGPRGARCSTAIHVVSPPISRPSAALW